MLKVLENRTIGILLDRPLSQAKFLQGILRFGKRYTYKVLLWLGAAGAIIDTTVEQLLKDIPVVYSLQAAVRAGVDTLLIGFCPLDANALFPARLLPIVNEALACDLLIINPLHATEKTDPALSCNPQARGKFINLREYAARYVYAGLPVRKKRVLCMGTDCAVGKMTTALLVTEELLKRGVKVRFFATGQTGIMIDGAGVPLDHLAGDFMAGAVEHELNRLEAECDLVMIEGQGSLLNPAYGGVTLALLHGARPHGIILCDDAKRTHFKFLPDRILPTIWDNWAAVKILLPDNEIPELLGIARIAAATQTERGLPVCDPLAGGVAPLVKNIMEKLLV